MDNPIDSLVDRWAEPLADYYKNEFNSHQRITFIAIFTKIVAFLFFENKVTFILYYLIAYYFTRVLWAYVKYDDRYPLYAHGISLVLDIPLMFLMPPLFLFFHVMHVMHCYNLFFSFTGPWTRYFGYGTFVSSIVLLRCFS